MTSISSSILMEFQYSTMAGICNPQDPTTYARDELHYMLSSYLRGEEFAVRAAMNALNRGFSSLDYVGKLASEEAAHVATLRKYIESEFGFVADLEPPFFEMLSAGTRLPIELSLLVLHLVIEPFGIGSLTAISRNIIDVRLRALINEIIADELEHVKLPEQNYALFEPFLLKHSFGIARWIDNSVVAMSVSACPRNIYKKHFPEIDSEQVASMAALSGSVIRQAQGVYLCLSRARKRLPILGPFCRPIKDLLNAKFEAGSFLELSKEW